MTDLLSPEGRERIKQLLEDANGPLHFTADQVLQEACFRWLSALLAALEESESRVQRLREALEPFARFAAAWRRKPLAGIDDEFYAIHVGEDGASLRLSDCQRAEAALKETGA